MLHSTVQHILRDNYTIAKIRGEKGLLLDRQQLYSLAEFRVQSEVLGVLADGTYGKELAELKEGSHPIEVERAIRLGFARVVRTLLTSSQSGVKEFLQRFTQRFDAYDLASLVIFRGQNRPWEDYVATRQPLALLKESELHRIYSIDDLRTIVGISGDRILEARVKDFSMQDMQGEKAALVRDIILGWGEERFFNYIDGKLYGVDRETCLPIIGATIDVANIVIILRSKLIGISNITDHSIDSSWKLDKKTRDQLLASQDVGQALELLSSHSYYSKILLSARQKYDESKSLSFMEVASRNHSLALGRRIFSGFPYTLGIVLAFLVLKENEARSIAAMFAGVGAGMKPEQMRSMVAFPA